MTRLRPNEVFRKIQSKNRFQIQIENWELGQFGPGGKIPATVPKSTALSTWESTGSDQVDSPVDLAVDLAQTPSPAWCTILRMC